MRTDMETASHAAISVLRSVLAGLESSPRPDGLGKIIQISSAISQTGTSYVARNLALLAAESNKDNVRRIGLFDCDLNQLAQTSHFFASQRANDMHGPYDATFGQAGFWHVKGADGQGREMPSLCSIYIDNTSDLAVTSFFWDQLMSGESVSIRRAQSYWHALRSNFSYVFVDTPALDRSHDGLLIAPECDGTILVASAEDSAAAHNAQARDGILSAGGRYMGLLINAGAPMRLVTHSGGATA